jgi:hypothetical protein
MDILDFSGSDLEICRFHAKMNLFHRDGPRYSGGQYAQVRVFDLKGEEGPISWVILVSYWTQLESWRGSTPGASYHDRVGRPCPIGGWTPRQRGGDRGVADARH